MDRQTLCDWVHRYNIEGTKGLYDRGNRGRKARLIPAATENDSCIRWYKGRDCGPRSEQGIAAKAVPVVNEGPAGAVRQGRTGVRHNRRKKCQFFSPLVSMGIRWRSWPHGLR